MLVIHVVNPPKCYCWFADRLTVPYINPQFQRAKKVVSDSPRLVNFAIGLVNSVFNSSDRQVMFFEEFE